MDFEQVFNLEYHRIIIQIDYDLFPMLIMSSSDSASHIATLADPIRILLIKEQIAKVILIYPKVNSYADLLAKTVSIRLTANVLSSSSKWLMSASVWRYIPDICTQTMFPGFFHFLSGLCPPVIFKSQKKKRKYFQFQRKR